MKSPVHILYLEDEANDVELSGELLNRANIDCEIFHVMGREEFISALDEQEFDLILADYALPSFDGLTALSLAKGHSPDIPFILVTGQLGEEPAIESLKAGATDYVLKQKRARLVPAVRRALKEAEEHRQRLQAEAELRRLATAIGQSAEVVVVTGREGNIQYANPAFERITGYKLDDVLGENMSILKSGKHDEDFYEDLWRTLKGGAVWTGHFTNMRKDGSIYEEHATISPVFDAVGSITNFVAVKRDVTERTVLEQRLRQAQKLEALGTLAGGIAHDFNNVLAAIIGYGQLAARGLDKESQERKDLDYVLDAANRAKDLVWQILTFSRQREQKSQPVHLHLIVKEALKFLRPTLPATIAIKSDIDQKCAPVYGDPTQMHQVIMNLCTNAYFAMKENGGDLHVALEVAAVGEGFVRKHPGMSCGDHAKLTVKDTGHGMDRTTMSRIFDPFFTTKGESEGTGMGLSTVHGIVQAHGGAIVVDSEPGVGTVFEIYWPFAETMSKEQARRKMPVLGGNERILIVDDEKILADLMGTQLRSIGYETVVKTSSADALEDFQKHPDAFDLLITDHVMPGMTGLNLIQEVKELRNDMPVISISGSDEGNAGNGGDQTPNHAFLKKPFNQRVLTKTVRKILDEARAGNAVLPEENSELIKIGGERKA